MDYLFVGVLAVVIGGAGMSVVVFMVYAVGALVVDLFGLAVVPPAARPSTDTSLTWPAVVQTWWFIPLGTAVLGGVTGGLAGVGYVVVHAPHRLAAWYAHLTGSEPE